MKTIFTNSYFNKTLKSLLTFCVILLMSINAFTQVTATEEFENETVGTGVFNESGINFTFNNGTTSTQKLGIISLPPFGFGGSAKFLELATQGSVFPKTATATIAIANAGIGFKINSFAGLTAEGNSGSPNFNGLVTISGTPVGGGATVSATISILSVGPVGSTGVAGQSRDANGVVSGITFAGTALDGLYFTSLSFSITDTDNTANAPNYLELDHINFTTSVASTNTYAIANTSFVEGNTGTTVNAYTVTRSVSTAAGSVQIQSSNGTATSGTDYVAVPLTTVNFPIGSLSQTVNVTINGDATIEPNETINMTLSNPTGGTIAVGAATITILTDDNYGETFEGETATASTFSEGGINFQSTGKLSVFNPGSGSGVGAGGSFAFLGSTTPYATGNQGSIQVASVGKAISMLSVDLWSSNVVSNTFPPTNCTVTFVGTKTDGTGTVTHTANITPSGTNVYSTVNFAGTPFDGVSILSISFSVSSAANYLNIDNFTFAPINVGTQISIDDVGILEGTLGVGTTSAVFTVSRTNNTSTFSVNVASSNGTATAGSDYTALPTTTLNFTSGGGLTQTVTLPIIKDATNEPNETFNMTLSNPTNGTLFLKQVGIGTIFNDDGGVGETFEDEINNATTFTQNGATFSATGGYKVVGSSGGSQGSGASAYFLTSTNNAVGNMGTITITSPNTAFKIISLDSWVGTSSGAFSSGPVTFTGTLYSGGTVTATKTITATSNTGTGWQQGITFIGTDLDNVNLTALQVSTGGSLKYCDIDNFNFTAVNFAPIIDVVDASNNAITNGGAAGTANNTDFGGVCVSAGTVSKTYTIKNLGQNNLTLSGSPLAVLGGTDANQFSITTQPTSPITPAGSTTVVVSFDPSLVGVKNATITLTNNDATNSPYVINIKGTGNVTAAPTSPTATPANVCTSGTVTLSATGCSGTLSWFDASDNSSVSSTPMVSANKSFYAKCTVSGCVSVGSSNVNVTVVTPLVSSPGNVSIAWTGLVSTDWNTACNWNPAWVPDATNSQVVIDLQTNQPTVTGIVPNVKIIYMNAGVALTVASGGALTVNQSGASSYINMQGAGSSIINDGTINIGAGTGGFGITATNSASITNRGTISTNNTSGIISLFSNTLTILNESAGIINSDFRSVTTSIINLTNHGTINYSGANNTIGFAGVSSLVNDGTVNITTGNGISNLSGGIIINNACGKILMSSGGYDNGGTTTNAGLIQLPNAYDFTNTGTFTNNGVLKAKSVSSITNNKMVIINACPIFTLGGTNNYTVSGIFTDAAATTSAGTYVSVGNKFTANNTISTGTQTLYAQVTNGTCTFVVPFDFNNVKPTAVSVDNTTVCTGASVTLSATCVSGTPTWYTTPTGGTSVGTGASLSNSPTVATTYYVACETTNCVSGRVATSAVSINSTLPTANATPSTQTICSGGTITTIAITGTGTSYTWTRNNTASVTGITANGSGDISGSLTNTTEAPITVTFTITPVGTCNGTPITATVVVNPIPTVTASTPSQSICSGADISGITFNNPPPVAVLLPNPSSDVVPIAPKTVKGIVFSSFVSGTVLNWTRDNTATVTGIPASGSGNISGTLTNTTSSPVIVTFTITPSYTNAGTTCTGTPITVTVTVNPIPIATITDAGTAFCSGSSTTLSAPANPNYTYAWERSLTGITSPNEFTAFGGTAQTQIVTTSGVYRVIVTNQGCSARDTTAVRFGDFVFNGSLGAGDAQQTGRMFRNAIASTCASVKAYPGISSPTGLRFYDSYTVTNPTNAPVCVTIGLTSGCGTSIFSATYLNSYDPAALATNYLADHGSSFPLTGFYEATIPANGTIVVVVHEVNPNTGCSNYNLRIDVPGATVAPTASSNSPICAGSTLNLTNSGIGTYAWTGPNSFTSSAQNPSIANATTLATGTYTVRVTNTNNCVFNATTAVTVNGNPTATASSNSPVCGGTTLNLIGGGVGTYSWTSSNGFISTAQSPTILNANISLSGTYMLTVTNNGCTSTASVAVTVNPNPTATASSNSPICVGNTISLSGGGIGTYSWTGVNGFTSTDQNPSIPNATILSSGTYRITVTNVSGCTSTAMTSVTVNPNPTATASSNSPVCVGNTISLMGGGVGTYSWTSSNGFTSTAQSPTISNVTVSASGTYTITVTNANGCTSTSSVSVTVNALPTATASNNSPICSGATLNLIGGGVGSYLWTGPGTFTSSAQSPNVLSATASMSGTYTITVTNINGCTSTATTSVTVNPVVITPTPQANTQIIFGASITLTAIGCSNANDVLKWYKSSDNALATMPVSPTATTNFYAKCETTLNGITCISGNSVDVTVTVLQPNPPVATGATNCIGTPTTLTATGCSGSVGTFVLKWYQNADDALVTMPVSPLVSTDYYAKCEQTFNAITAVSAKSNVVTLTILNPPTPVSTGGTIYNSQSISLTATGCTGTLGIFTLRWYQTADNVLVTMPVSPTATTQYYAKCEQTANSITCLSAKSNDVTVTVVNRIFVDITKIAAPIQNGNSWATAYGNLQTGLAAATANVEVWVAKGTYKPTNTITRTIYFNIPNNVKVYGGFAGTEDLLSERNFRTNVSILSGDIGTQKLATDNSYHVVVLDGASNTTVVDGFTISDGYANFDPNRTYLVPNALAPTTGSIETGGGILVQNAGMPTIANCIIISNSAVTGGGLYAGDASMPNIIACKFMANQSGFGSGMYFQDGSNGKVNNTLISGNRGIGGVYNNNSNPMLINVTFGGNGGYNGGIFNSNSQPIVKNSIIWGNSTPFNDTQSIITYSTIQGGYAGVGNLSMDPKFVNLTPEGLSPSINGDYHIQASSLTIDRGDNGTISLTDKDLDGNLRRFSGGKVDMGAYEFQGTATANLVISAQTGNWESNSTWVGFKVPQLGDYVIIDNNHIVTLSTTGIAKNLEYRGTGQLKFNTTTSKLEIGF